MGEIFKVILFSLISFQLAAGITFDRENHIQSLKLKSIAPPPPTPDMRCIPQAKLVHEVNSGCARGMDMVNLTCQSTDKDYWNCVKDPKAAKPLALYMSCSMSQTFLDTLQDNKKSDSGFQPKAGQLSIMETNLTMLDSLGGKPIVNSISDMPTTTVDYAFPKLFDGAQKNYTSSQGGGGYGGGGSYGGSGTTSAPTAATPTAYYNRLLMQTSKVQTPEENSITIAPVAPTVGSAMYCKAFGDKFFNAWYIAKKQYVYDIAIQNGYFLNSTSQIVEDFPTLAAPTKQDIVLPASGNEAAFDQVPAGMQSTQSKPSGSTPAPASAPSKTIESARWIGMSYFTTVLIVVSLLVI